MYNLSQLFSLSFLIFWSLKRAMDRHLCEKHYQCINIMNRIGGDMVSVLASNAVDCGFQPRSGQTKDYKICISCFSAKHTLLRRKSKD